MAEALYAFFGEQYQRILKRLRAKRYTLEAVQALRAEQIASKESLLDVDWAAEEEFMRLALSDLLLEIVNDSFTSVAQELTTLSDGMDVALGVSWEVYDAAAAEWARRYEYDLIKQINDSTAKQIGDTIGRWIENGEEFPYLVERIRSIVPANHFPHIRDRAQLIAATETTRVYAESRAEGLRAAGLHKSTWNTANDEIVCPLCGPLNGVESTGNMTWIDPNSGDTVGIPPRHPGCRCWITASTSELEANAGMTDDVQPLEPEAKPEEKPEVSAAPPVFQTAKEAAKWGQDNLGLPTVDYGKLPVEIANAFNESAHDMLSRFPKLRDQVEYIGSGQVRNRMVKEKVKARLMGKRDEFYDMYIRSGRSEAFAKRYADSWLNQQMNAKAGRFEKNVWAYAYDKHHEISGIGFNEKYSTNDVIIGLEYSMSEKFHPEGADSLRSIVDHEFGHQLDYLMKLRNERAIGDMQRRAVELGMKENLSEYARRNTAEFIAESWAEYVNNPSPRPIAREVGDYIVKRYEELFP